MAIKTQFYQCENHFSSVLNTTKPVQLYKKPQQLPLIFTKETKGSCSSAGLQQNWGTDFGAGSHRYSSLCTYQTSSKTRLADAARMGCFNGRQKVKHSKIVDHDIATYCGNNLLILKVTRTLESIMECRRETQFPSREKMRFLDVHLDTWAILVMQRRDCLQKETVDAFSVFGKMLHTI